MTTINPIIEQWVRYVDFLQAREQAREAKEFGIYPHTEDPILAKYSFCNINREHDRVTQWVKATVRDNPRIQNATAMVVRIAIARIFNDPATFEGMVEPIGIDNTLAHVLERQKQGKRIFRGAYMMPSHGSSTQLKMPPAIYYLEACRRLLGAPWGSIKTLEGACAQILGVHGFGPFLANQIVTDLRYTKWWRHADDWGTFVLGGPGTSRGLCRMFGEPLRIDKNQNWIHERLMIIRQMTLDTLGESPINTYFLDPNNVSNSFCEFDKYERVRLNEGRLNRFYKTKP